MASSSIERSCSCPGSPGTGTCSSNLAPQIYWDNEESWLVVVNNGQ